MICLCYPFMIKGADRHTADKTGMLLNEYNKRFIHAKHINIPIQVDGELDDEEWRNVQFQENFIQREPDEGKPHVRFDVAGDGNQDRAEAIRHSQRKRRATSCLAYVSGAIP